MNDKTTSEPADNTSQATGSETVRRYRKPASPDDRLRGTLLQNLRLKRKLDFAGFADLTGLSVDVIRQSERGAHSLTAQEIQAICVATETPVVYFFPATQPASMRVLPSGEPGMSLGAWLKEKRLLKGYSQTDAANRIGITKQAISKIERDDNQIGPSHLEKYAETVGVTVQEIVERMSLD